MRSPGAGYRRGMSEQPNEPDTVSDPARDDETGADWTTEGGATEQGPATSTDDDH